MTDPNGGGSAVSKLLSLAQQLNTAQSQSQYTSGNYPVYTGTTVTEPIAQTGGNILVRGGGVKRTDNYYGPDAAGEIGTQAYFNKLVALQQTNPSAYVQYQQALFKNNFYGNTKPNYGQFGSADTTAFSNALQQYGIYLQALTKGGGRPVTFEQYLANGAKSGGVGGPTRAPLQVSLTDPTEIKATLQSAAQDALGRNLNDKELAAFVSKFQGLQKSAQTNAYNGASSVTQPDLSGQAAQYVISQHGPEHDQKLAAGFLSSLERRLGVNV